MEKGLKVANIIKMIPEEVLDKLAEETNVDRHVKKLSGKSLFQLFLFSLSAEASVMIKL